MVARQTCKRQCIQKAKGTCGKSRWYIVMLALLAIPVGYIPENINKNHLRCQDLFKPIVMIEVR